MLPVESLSLSLCMCIGVDMRILLMYTIISISLLNPVQKSKSRKRRAILSLVEIFARDI